MGTYRKVAVKTPLPKDSIFNFIDAPKNTKLVIKAKDNIGDCIAGLISTMFIKTENGL